MEETRNKSEVSTGMVVGIAIIIAILFGGGAYAYVNNKATKDKEVLNAQITELQSQVSSGTVASGTAPTTDPSTIVTKFYSLLSENAIKSDSLASAPGGSQDLQTWHDSGAGYSWETAHHANAILCAQDTPPTFSVKTLSKDSSSAQVAVTENFTPAVVLTVNLKANDASWQLVSVTCPN